MGKEWPSEVAIPPAAEAFGGGAVLFKCAVGETIDIDIDSMAAEVGTGFPMCHTPQGPYNDLLKEKAYGSVFDHHCWPLDGSNDQSSCVPLAKYVVERHLLVS